MQTVPCGNCLGCRKEQTRQWGVRMMHEARMHRSSAFVTLTLDDEHLNENRELHPADFSRFVKDLRKTQQGRISYFGCGEYGETTARPHYHAVLFGINFLDRDIGFDPSRPDVWRSKSLEDCWGRGLCEGGSVTMGSASYVAGYVRKKVKAERYERSNPFTGQLLQQEFARMSLRPPIGRRWIEKWWRDVYPRDFVVIDGVEAKPPRYYDKWMDFPDEKGGSLERRAMMEDVRDERYAKAVDLTRYTLNAKMRDAECRANLFEARNTI